MFFIILPNKYDFSVLNLFDEINIKFNFKKFSFFNFFITSGIKNVS